MNTKQMIEEIVYRNHIINIVVSVFLVAFLAFCMFLIVAEHRERMKQIRKNRDEKL